MTFQPVTMGTLPNDGSGDSFRAGGLKINANFSELYTLILAAVSSISPHFTGIPTAPTAAFGTNTTQLATMAALQAAIAGLVNSSPGALDTLKELADALGDDPNFATTMTNALAGKQPLDADLTAIAALTTTSYGRSVLSVANAGALQILAGLVIGTNIQAQNANLQAIAGLASAANKMEYYTGSGAAALADLTVFARSLLALSDAPSVANALAASYVPFKSGVASAVTGTLTETTLASFTLPASAMGVNGQLEMEFLYSVTGSTNAKTLKIKFGGTVFYSNAVIAVGTLGVQAKVRISNRNSAVSQVGLAAAIAAGIGAAAAAPQLGTVNTAAPVLVEITGTLANTGETITLESYLARVTN